jgi:hypothetical protein
MEAKGKRMRRAASVFALAGLTGLPDFHGAAVTRVQSRNTVGANGPLITNVVRCHCGDHAIYAVKLFKLGLVSLRDVKPPRDRTACQAVIG